MMTIEDKQMKSTIEMAREAWGEHHEIFWFEDDGIEKFADLVRADAIADEREACARRAEIALLGGAKVISDHVLKAIRARGNT
jgi:hypothetical protein